MNTIPIVGTRARWILLLGLLLFLAIGRERTAHATPSLSELMPPPDDEIVLLTSIGRIIVVDPRTPAYIQPVSFQSESTGWQRLALGDVNGDGDQEIIALKPTQLHIFDPVVQPGSVPISTTIVPPTGQWHLVATGDMDGDGQDEILASHTTGQPDTPEKVVVLDPNADGSTFQEVYTHALEVPVKALDAGDVDGDGWEDGVVLGDIRALFFVFQGGLWDTLVNYFELKPWLALSVGQVRGDSARAEIATSRLAPDDWDSYLLYQWVGGGNVVTIDQVPYHPAMDDLDTFDMNGDGDEEVLLVRSDDSAVPVIVRNPAGPALMRDIQIWAGPGWKRIAGGDIDGDGLGEIVILKERGLRMYLEPELSDRQETRAGNFLLELAVGNLDGSGIITAPVLRLSANTISFHYEAYTLPPAQYITVENAGAGGSIPWQATVVEGGDWLRISPTSGTTPGQLVFSVEPRHLRAGSYEGRVRVEAPGALDSPQDVVVRLTVVTPVLEVQPRSVGFDAQKGHAPINRVVGIRNVGVGGSIGWRAREVEDEPWLTITPVTGTTPAELTIVVDPTQMEPGTYIAQVSIAADDPVVSNSPITVTVVANIYPPVLDVSPTSFYLNAIPGKVYSPFLVRIQQRGVPDGQAIRWVAGVIPSVHSLPNGIQTLTNVTHVAREGVMFEYDGKQILVPSLDWVTLDPWYGTTPSIMAVRVAVDRMTPGVYYATIVVDGGPGTANRFQGIDLKVVIPAQRTHLPYVEQKGTP